MAIATAMLLSHWSRQPVNTNRKGISPTGLPKLYLTSVDVQCEDWRLVVGGLLETAILVWDVVPHVLLGWWVDAVLSLRVSKDKPKECVGCGYRWQ